MDSPNKKVNLIKVVLHPVLDQEPKFGRHLENECMCCRSDSDAPVKRCQVIRTMRKRHHFILTSASIVRRFMNVARPLNSNENP